MSKLTSLICSAVLLGFTTFAYADNHTHDSNSTSSTQESDKAQQRPDGNTDQTSGDTGAKKSDVQKLRKKSDVDSKPNQSGGSSSSGGKY